MTKSKSTSVSAEKLVAAIRHMNQVGRTRKGTLAAAIGTNERTAARALAYLYEDGFVEKDGRWYSLAGMIRIVPTDQVGCEIVPTDQNRDICCKSKNTYVPIRIALPAGSELGGSKTDNILLVKDERNRFARCTSEVAAGAGDRRPADNENKDTPFEMQAIEYLLLKVLNAWKAHNGNEGRKERTIVGYRPAFRHWRDLRWLVLYLAMLEPLAYLMWADYRKKAYKQLDELIPDWQHSMAWATSHVMGFDDDEAECPGHVPDWMLETSDLETKEEQAAPQSAPTGPLAQVENQGVDRVEDQQDVELVAVQATRPTPSVAIEAPEVEAPAHLTGGGDNLLLELVRSGDRGVAEKEILRVTNPETISELIGKGAAVRVGDCGITMIRYVPQEKYLSSMDSSVEEWLAKNPAAQWKIDDLLKAAQAQHDDHAYLALKRVVARGVLERSRKWEGYYQRPEAAA